MHVNNGIYTSRISPDFRASNHLIPLFCIPPSRPESHFRRLKLAPLLHLPPLPHIPLVPFNLRLDLLFLVGNLVGLFLRGPKVGDSEAVLEVRAEVVHVADGKG